MGIFSNGKFYGDLISYVRESSMKFREFFVDGFNGHGWKLWQHQRGRWKLSIDDLLVRGSMTIYELIVSKIRAVMGWQVISDGNGIIKDVIADDENGRYYIEFEDVLTFVKNDLIRCQKFTGKNVKSYWVEVADIVEMGEGDTKKQLIAVSYEDTGWYNGSVPEVGDEVVLLGNTNKDSGRQDAIVMHTADGPPAIDIMDGICDRNFADKVKVRLGLGEIDGHTCTGFYAKNGRMFAVDDKGEEIYSFNPDGTGQLCQGAIQWSYDKIKKEWIINANGVRLVLSDDQKEELKGQDGKDGANGSYYISVYRTTIAQPATPTGDVAPPSGWSLTPTSPTDTAFVWMSQVLVDGMGQLGNWSTPIRISGRKGNSGEDGTDIEFIYLRLPISDPPETPESKQEDDYIPADWADNPRGVSEVYQYEWVCVRYKHKGIWTDFSIPALWSNWGEKGMDGDGFEYIYRRTTTDKAPLRPTTVSQEDDYVPLNWTDDPTGVNETYMYEWVSIRKKHNGDWGAFTTPALWAKWGKDGESGQNGKDGMDAVLPDWLTEWDGTSTELGHDHFISPSIYAGTKSEESNTYKYKGVLIGSNVITIDDIPRTGILGINSSEVGEDGSLQAGFDDVKFMLDAETGDVLVRGTIYAEDGEFKGKLIGASGEFNGKVSIAGGKILLNDNGSGQLANGRIKWSSGGLPQIDAAIISPFRGAVGVGYWNPNTNRMTWIYKLTDIFSKEMACNYILTLNDENERTEYEFVLSKELKYGGAEINIYVSDYTVEGAMLNVYPILNDDGRVFVSKGEILTLKCIATKTEFIGWKVMNHVK